MFVYELTKLRFTNSVLLKIIYKMDYLYYEIKFGPELA